MNLKLIKHKNMGGFEERLVKERTMQSHYNSKNILKMWKKKRKLQNKI